MAAMALGSFTLLLTSCSASVTIEAQPDIETTPVLVATTPLKAGMSVREIVEFDDWYVKVVDLPGGPSNAVASVADLVDFDGMVTARRFDEGEVLDSSELSGNRSVQSAGSANAYQIDLRPEEALAGAVERGDTVLLLATTRDQSDELTTKEVADNVFVFDVESAVEGIGVTLELDPAQVAAIEALDDSSTLRLVGYSRSYSGAFLAVQVPTSRLDGEPPAREDLVDVVAIGSGVRLAEGAIVFRDAVLESQDTAGSEYSILLLLSSEELLAVASGLSADGGVRVQPA